MKKILCLVLVLMTAFAFAACKEETKLTSGSPDETKTETSSKEENAGSSFAEGEIVKVAIEVKDHGKMVLELYPDVAPITVENFVSYVKDGFYDGLTFHRVDEGFMIQGGDPEGNGTGGGDKGEIKGEFASNGVKNDLSHKRGVISMARSGAPNSASSQFFICHADSTFLDGDYAAFGMLVEGFETLDSIANVEVKINMFGEKTAPVTPVTIEKAYIVE